MKRIKALGLCLLAVFALTGVAASVAQAEEAPEFYTKTAIGVPGAPQPFTATVAAASFWEGSVSKLKIECKKTTGAGEVTGAKTLARYRFVLKECEIATLNLPCENKGAGTKEIETESLKGELGAVSATTPGIRLKPEGGEFVTQYECAGGAESIKWKGSVISSGTGSGTTVDNSKFASSLKQVWAESKGIQKYTHFLTGPSEQLTSEVKEGANPPTEELIGVSGTFTFLDTENPTDDNWGVTK
jgi:hypothetical protein